MERIIRVGLGLALLWGLAADAGAEPLYRGMKVDPQGNGPQVARSNLGLGVRPSDVIPGPDGTIPTTEPGTDIPQGTSVVAGDPCTLPAFSRPADKGWNGTGGPHVRVWVLDTAELPAKLTYRPAPTPSIPNHGVIGPAQDGRETLDSLDTDIAGTAPHWQVREAPPAACPP